MRQLDPQSLGRNVDWCKVLKIENQDKVGKTSEGKKPNQLTFYALSAGIV